MVKTKVVVPKLAEALSEFMPRELARLGPTSQGIFLNNPQKGSIPFKQLRAMSAFSYAKDGRRKTALVLFLRNKRQPFLISARHILYSKFPDIGAEPSVSNFRAIVHHFLRKEQGLRRV